MAQALFVNNRPPTSISEVAIAVVTDASKVVLLDRGLFSRTYLGPLSEAPDGTYTFVGPTQKVRRFFGMITVDNGSIVVSRGFSMPLATNQNLGDGG